MLVHFIRIAIIILIILFCMFYPFMPGSYDGLAVTISSMAQFAGIAGLLLVPIGVLWLLFELNRKKNGKTTKNRPAGFLIATLVAMTFIGLAISFGAFSNHNFFLGICTLVLFVIVLAKTGINLKKNKETVLEKFKRLPVYLICIPLIVFLIRLWCIVPATEFSRNRAIRNSAELIQDIESFYKQNGHYPVSLHSLYEDYDPLVTGIKRYYYEPNGKAYNLFFEQFTYDIGTNEIVMYNKLDEQGISSHNYDLLHLSPADINRQRGFHFSKELAQPHWKLFWFD